jgi:serine/threonine protein kinase/tetratricopeptide (TPR) repeat protein
LSSDVVQLGDFQLLQRIGEGGMGRVFRGRHVRTEVEVAVKVLHRRGEDVARGAFWREVQAQAAMTHPGIVYLFDYGTVDGAIDWADEEGLADGSPFAVMEYTAEKTLRERGHPSSWGELREVLAQILDPLAYAHARGVIHRDLKPENLLVFPEDDRYRIKIADFGLAHRLRAEGEFGQDTTLRGASGTPYYMAPEQLRGGWRHFGPWTDLYAVGCIAWELSTGRPPFVGENLWKIAMQHLDENRPRLVPKFSLPPKAREWIQRAMARHVEDRFPDAASAARALPSGSLPSDQRGLAWMKRLEADEPEAVSGLDETVRAQLTPTFADPPLHTTLTGEPVDSADAADEPPRAAADASSTSDDDVFPGWTMERPRVVDAIAGTGLALFALRDIPFVGRERERDTIWEALGDVWRRGELRAVLVAGAAGTGKSRLMRWCATRALELGLVQEVVLRNSGDASMDGAGMSGLAGMARRLLRAWELRGDALREHLEETLPVLPDGDPNRADDLLGMRELIDPRDDAAGASHSDSTRDRYALLARVLSRFAADRPLLLRADDLHLSEDSLGFLSYLATHWTDLPALVLGAYRSDQLGRSDRVERLVDGLSARPNTVEISLEPLRPQLHRQLVDEMLALAPRAADRLARRTEGNPLFAHQLISHWIEDEAISLTDDGFEVSADVELPDEIQGLWMQRVEQVLERYPEPQRDSVYRSLLLGAVFGRSVHRDEWEAGHDQLGLDLPADLEDQLVELGLAVPERQGFQFVHELLWEMLSQQCRSAGEWARFHLACAEALERIHGADRRDLAPRLARHFYQAGELERALAPLLVAERYLYMIGDEDHGRHLDRYMEVLDRLGAPEDDPRRLEGTINRIQYDWIAGRTEQGWERIQSALPHCTGPRHREAEVKLLRHASTFSYRRGEFDAALDYARRAAELADSLGDSLIQAMAYSRLGDLRLKRGEVDDGERLLREAIAHYRNSDRDPEMTWAMLHLGWVLVDRGELEEAEQTFQRIREVSVDYGSVRLRSNCENALGSVATERGDFDEARQFFHEFLRLERDLGDREGQVVASINLASLSIRTGDLDRAERHLGLAASILEGASLARLEPYVQVLEFLLATQRRDWSRASALLAPFETAWDGEISADHELIWALELAGDCASGERPELAEASYRIAVEMAEELEAPSLQTLREKLHGLG